VNSRISTARVGESANSPSQRRQRATTEEVSAALVALDSDPHLIAASSWPGDLSAMDTPGLYAWWVDEEGARDLTQGLGEPVKAGRIYAGQTGATKWPSAKTGSATLRSRIGSQHVRGRIRSSTFRLTLAASLARSLGLQGTEMRRLEPASEHALSQWIRTHLSVAVYPFPNPDVLGDLEHRVLTRLDPPLNLDGLAANPVRTRLSELRRALNG
jgi:hypothetical protein